MSGTRRFGTNDLPRRRHLSHTRHRVSCTAKRGLQPGTHYRTCRSGECDHLSMAMGRQLAAAETPLDASKRKPNTARRCHFGAWGACGASAGAACHEAMCSLDPQEDACVVKVEIARIVQKPLRGDPFADRVEVAITAGEMVKHDRAAQHDPISNDLQNARCGAVVVRIDEGQHEVLTRQPTRRLNNISDDYLHVAALETPPDERLIQKNTVRMRIHVED